MAQRKTQPARGIIRTIDSASSAGAFTHGRYQVDPPLDASIEHWWSVRWRLPRGVVQERCTLPHPCVHVVMERDAVRVVGVVRGRFTWVTEGEGDIFAAKFRPGAFRAVLKAAVATLTDRIVPLSAVIGAARARDYTARLVACANDDERVVVATDFFGGIVPAPSHDDALMRSIVEDATRDRTINSVDSLCERSGLHVRELQRWFKDAVGISPKWMIQRYRLHDALVALEAGDRNIAQVAADLGYADQADFARDFKALTGQAPSRYVAVARAHNPTSAAGGSDVVA